MSEQTKQPESALCPTCHQPHGGVQELKFEAKLAERDHKDALEKAAANAERLTTEAATLAAQLAQERNKPAPEPVETHLPPMDEIFEHWQNCPTCKPLLEARAKTIRANVLDGLTSEEVLPVMKRLGIQRAPKELIFKSGG